MPTARVDRLAVERQHHGGHGAAAHAHQRSQQSPMPKPQPDIAALPGSSVAEASTGRRRTAAARDDDGEHHEGDLEHRLRRERSRARRRATTPITIGTIQARITSGSTAPLLLMREIGAPVRSAR